jgi:LmbE family N-acetylglucosaminyl deacetylase
LKRRLKGAIARKLKHDQPVLVLDPLGVGGHPDHLIVFELMLELLNEGVVQSEFCRFYEDLPYSSLENVDKRIGEISNTFMIELSPVSTDISEVISFRTKGVNIYSSQFEKKDVMRIEDYLRDGTSANSSERSEAVFRERSWKIVGAKDLQMVRLPAKQRTL